MTIKFLDLKKSHIQIKKGIKNRFENIFNNSKYILGNDVFEVEKKLSEYVKNKYAITCGNGTDALLMALMSIGVQAGDEVITTPFTWISNVEMIKLLGAKPIFADVDSRTFNIDPIKIKKLISKKTKCILVVNIFGQCADYDKINKIAKQYNLRIIEDAAQSFGAVYKNKLSCNLADISCTSFFPSKPLGCYGDGGACFTNNKALKNKLLLLRNHGQTKKNIHQSIGINSRLDTLQAAVLLEKLVIFKNEIKLRKKVAENYNKLISYKNIDIKIPFIEKFNQSVYAQYTILVKNRKNIIKKLKKNSIPFSIFYPKPIYKQTPYKQDIKHKNVEKICSMTLSLPMHPYLKINDQKKIVDCLE